MSSSHPWRTDMTLTNSQIKIHCHYCGEPFMTTRRKMIDSARKKIIRSFCSKSHAAIYNQSRNKK